MWLFFQDRCYSCFTEGYNEREANKSQRIWYIKTRSLNHKVQYKLKDSNWLLRCFLKICLLLWVAAPESRSMKIMFQIQPCLWNTQKSLFLKKSEAPPNDKWAQQLCLSTPSILNFLTRWKWPKIYLTVVTSQAEICGTDRGPPTWDFCCWPPSCSRWAWTTSHPSPWLSSASTCTFSCSLRFHSCR